MNPSAPMGAYRRGVMSRPIRMTTVAGEVRQTVLAGVDAPPADNTTLRAKAKVALDLLDAALKRAQDIISNETESTWAKIKAAVTSTNLTAVQGEVKQLTADVWKMHDVFGRFDASTPPAKLQDFIKACAQMADLSVLTDTTERNQLTALAKEVGSGTIAAVVAKAKDIAEPIADVAGSWIGALWKQLPWWGKVGVVAVPSAGVILAIRSRLGRR